MTVETIAELDQFGTPCIDLREMGAMEDSENFNALMATETGQNLKEMIGSHVREDFTNGQLQGHLMSVQGLQVAYGHETAAETVIPMTIVPDGEISDHGASTWDKLKGGAEALVDTAMDKVDGIKESFNDAANGVKNAELGLNEGGLLKDVVDRNQNMEEMMAETSDVPQSPGMGM